MTIVLTVVVYFLFLLCVGRWSSGKGDNDTFFRGCRESPWWLVAIGMVGASLSGVTFVSVPGMVIDHGMTYLQTCLGFIVGYVVVAFVLLPLYYRLNLTTIYGYLRDRLGLRSYRTGAMFFLLSKLTGGALRFFVLCTILDVFVLRPLGVPFAITVFSMVLLIWLYTHRGGIKTLVWTDVIQTLCLFVSLVMLILSVVDALGLTLAEAFSAVASDVHSVVFEFESWHSGDYFWKQFLSGIFIVVVMTGLDQDMMQKHLTCKTLRGAQKDMCSYGVAFVPANLLFLCLGVLLLLLCEREGVALPMRSDSLLPMFAATGRLGEVVTLFFALGIVSASFSSADSALTSLTTSFCVDICERPDDERLRHRIHIGMAGVFVVFILLFRLLNSTSVIDAIYILCSYTYGPLLGLFAFGLLHCPGLWRSSSSFFGRPRLWVGADC